jgi:hypothetical protein
MNLLGDPMSRHPDVQLFSVLGSGYVPRHPGEYRDEIAPRSVAPARPDKGMPRGALTSLLVVTVLVASTLFVAGDVVAAIRHAKTASIAQLPVLSFSASFAGALEPTRW